MNKQPSKSNNPLPEPRPSRARRKASSWDCMDCIVIEEQERLELRETDEVPDKYWQEGWTFDINGIHRRDFDVDQDARYHRVYPTRYVVPNFKVTRSMRRVLARNRDLKIVTRSLRITPAKEDLFLAHHLQRFGYEPESTLNERHKYQLCHQVQLMEMCYFVNDTLIAFNIFERGAYSLWSNIGVWSPAHWRRGLGTLTILKEIEYARANDMLYYYMGNYWPGNPDYEYKTRFQPMELWDWDEKCWQPWGDWITNAMLTEKLRRRS